MTLFLLLLALRPAQAEGVDAHHFTPLPTLGEPLGLVETWRVTPQLPGSFSVSGAMDMSRGNAILVYEDWEGVVETPLLDSVLALNLSARAAITPRVSVALMGPLLLRSEGPTGLQGAGIGDLRLAAPISLLTPTDGGLALGVVPGVDLPTGDSTEYSGEPGLGLSALFAAGWRAERLSLDLNLGAQRHPVAEATQSAETIGGAALRVAGGASFALTPTLGLAAEANLERALGDGVRRPGEGLVSARGRLGSVTWMAGAGVGLGEAVGAPSWRLFGGVGYARVVDPASDRDLDGIVDDLDACVRKAEVKNGYNDADGCPDALSELALTAVNDEGAPVVGASLEVDGVTYTTDAQGRLSLPARAPDLPLNSTLSAEGYSPLALSRPTLPEGPQAETLTLPWLPGTVRVIVKDEAGAPIPALVELRGPTTQTLRLGAEGREQRVLGAGSWQLLVTAPGKGTEVRQITLDGVSTALTVVELTLRPPVVELQAKEVVITQAILFDLDAATLRPDAEPILRQVAGLLIEHPELTRIEIQGHTDDQGETDYNLKLSQARVETVYAWLVANGVAAERLVAKGYGESKPIQPNTTEAGQAANRRVQFVILEQQAPPKKP
ncbi:OmpA family protein [Myxococcota bacterium]|nr:OmpA family protein [Myxococcota bacterium]